MSNASYTYGMGDLIGEGIAIPDDDTNAVYLKKAENTAEQAILLSLLSAARSEQWDYVDASLHGALALPFITGWAEEVGIHDTDYRLRDLAVSMFEKSPDDLPAEIPPRLQHLMESDENIYVQYRSAFALFSHGIRDEAVIQKIRAAEAEPDVSAIAKEYLATL
jgi:hypothetical protein